MTELTRFESKLIDGMEEVYNEASKGVSLLRMFISHYDFDMREASDGTLHHIRGNWETAGQALYAITDYFETIEGKLEKFLFAESLSDLKLEYSEPQENHISDSKEELRKEAAEMLDKIEDEKTLILLHGFIKSGYLEDKAGKK